METLSGPTEIRTRVSGFKVRGANRYTMGPELVFYAFAHLSKDSEYLQPHNPPRGIDPNGNRTRI